MSTSRIKPKLLRRMTTRQILEVLHAQGPCSRADLTRLTGISAPTVSKAVAELLSSGLLEEGESPEGAMGRPGKRLQLATEGAEVFGVVLDADECQIVAADLGGSIDHPRTQTFRTPGKYSQLMDRVAGTLLEMQRPERISLGVGVSIPGLLNHHTQESLFSPNLRITHGTRPAHDLAKRLNVDTVAIQETHGLCLAERLVGAARGCDDFAMVDMTTGLGLGVMTGGQLLSGHKGLAGELGHITIDPSGRLCGCGNRGCLETLSTDTAFVAAMSERIGKPLRFEDIVAGLEDGTLEVDDELNHVSEFASVAIAAAINLFNPSTTFVHARLFELQDGLFERIVSLVRKKALAPSFEDCEITISRVNKQAGAVAAIIRHLTSAVGPSLEEV